MRGEVVNDEHHDHEQSKSRAAMVIFSRLIRLCGSAPGFSLRFSGTQRGPVYLTCSPFRPGIIS
jgi:hypothetical protein